MSLAVGLASLLKMDLRGILHGIQHFFKMVSMTRALTQDVENVAKIHLGISPIMRHLLTAKFLQGEAIGAEVSFEQAADDGDEGVSSGHGDFGDGCLRVVKFTTND